MLKKLEKAISLLLVVALLAGFAVLPVSAAPIAEGTNGKTIYLSLKLTDMNMQEIDSAAEDSYVYANVYFSGNSSVLEESVKNYNLLFSFDAAKLKYVGRDEDNALTKPEANSPSAGVVKAGWASNDGIYRKEGTGPTATNVIQTQGLLTTIWFQATADLGKDDINSIRFLATDGTDTIKMGDYSVVVTPALKVTVDENAVIYPTSSKETIKNALTVEHIDENGTASPVTSFDISYLDLLVGRNAITVQANGITETAYINVTRDKLQRIQVTSQPTKMTYQSGNEFDPAGLSVVAVFKSGREIAVREYNLTVGGVLLQAGTEMTVAEHNGKPILITATGIEPPEINGQTATTGSITVNPIPVEIPTATGTYTYTGEEQTFEVGNTSGNAYYTITGTQKGTNVGDYTAGVVLNDKTETQWADGTTDDITLTWSITANTAALNVAVSDETLVYDNGNEKKPATVTVTSNGTPLTEGTDYELAYTNCTNAGTATVTATGKGNYAGATGSANYTIGRATIAPAVTLAGWTYGQTANSPTVSGNPGNGTVTYKYYTNAECTQGETTAQPTNAGTYWVKASVEQTTNYKAANTGAVQFAIAKAAAPALTGSVSLYHESKTEGTLKASDLIGAPATGWTGVKFVGTPTISGDSVIASASVDEYGVLIYTPTGTAESGKTATVEATISSTNYEAATVTITFTTVNINIPWPTAGNGITIVGDPVYGMTNGDILKVTSDKLTATTTVNVPGTISVKDAAAYPAAGTTKVTLIFTPDAGYGVSGTFEYDYTITAVRAKDITVDADAISVEYGQSIPTLTFTVPDGALVGSDTKESLGLSLQTNASVGDSVGSYEISMRTCENKNYNVTVNGTRKLTITQASITKIEPWETLVVSLNANHSANTSIVSLKTLLNLPTGYPVYYAGGKIDMPVDWDDGSGTFNVKGGEYTFTGTIKLNNNFKNDKNVNLTLMAKVVVSPVMVTAITLAPNAATVAKSQATSASNLANLTGSVTATVTWDPTVVSDDDLKTLTPTWNTTIDAVKSAASQVSTTDTTVTLMMNNTFPAWATVEAAMPTFALTITPKYPVNVAFTTSITDTVYGTALATPVAEQMDAGHGTDGTITYTYYTASGTKLGGAPTNVGSYKVVAEVVSDTHSGKAECAFQITPRTATLVWDGTAERTFDNQNSAVTATVSNKIGSDNVTVTVSGGTEKNAGTHTATATALTGEAAGNYQLPESGLTQDYTITRADRGAITDVQDTTLAGKTLSAALTPEVEHDLDRSASFTFVSADPSVVSVSSNGKVTALANGSAVITITVPTTTNYNAASKTVTITAVATPVTGVSVPDDATYTATLDGQTIKVAGYIASDGSVTITPTLADGVTGNAVTIAAADIGKNAELEVTVDGKKIVYTVDTSAVTVKKANVTVHVKVSVSDELTGVDWTTAEIKNLDAAVAQEIFGEAAKNDKIKTIEVALKISVKSYDNSKVLRLELKPVVTYKDADGNPIGEVEQLIPNSAIRSLIQMCIPLPNGFTPNYAKHHLTSGGFEYLPIDLRAKPGFAIWKQSSFSEVELISDSRTATVTFALSDGSKVKKTLTPADIGSALPTDSKPGATFNGWSYGAASTPTKVLTEELLTALAQASGTVELTASFTPAGGGAIGGGGMVIAPAETHAACDRFDDVTPELWCHDAVEFVVDRGLMNGVTTTMFAPGRTLNRGMFVTILYRLAGSPAVTGSRKFSDVTDATWCRDAVIWAAENGIVTGFSDGTFQPAAAVSRQQLVTFLYRYAALCGYDTASGSLGAFADADAAGTYARDALGWAIRSGIVQGSAGRLNPQQLTNRGQTATILMRFLDLFEKA